MKPCCAACILPGLSSRFSGPPAYSALQCGYSTSPPFRTHTEVMSFDILPQILTQQKGNHVISPLHGTANSAPWSCSRRLRAKRHLSHPHILALLLDSPRLPSFLRACISSRRHTPVSDRWTYCSMPEPVESVPGIGARPGTAPFPVCSCTILQLVSTRLATSTTRLACPLRRVVLGDQPLASPDLL